MRCCYWAWNCFRINVMNHRKSLSRLIYRRTNTLNADIRKWLIKSSRWVMELLLTTVCRLRVLIEQVLTFNAFTTRRFYVSNWKLVNRNHSNSSANFSLRRRHWRLYRHTDSANTIHTSDGGHLRCHHGSYITRSVSDARDNKKVSRDAFRAHAAAFKRYRLRHARAVAARAQDLSNR